MTLASWLLGSARCQAVEWTCGDDGQDVGAETMDSTVLRIPPLQS